MPVRTDTRPDLELPCEGDGALADALPPVDGVSPEKMQLALPVEPDDVGVGAELPDRLVLGDCLGLMRQLPAASIDLIYVDPPFATGREHAARSEVAYSDVWAGGRAGYLEWLAPRLAQMHRLLRKTGSLFLHLDWRAVHPAKLLLDDLFGERCFRNEIVWHYGSGGRARRFFHRKHDVILWYSRTGKWQFYPEAVEVPRDRCPSCGARREKWNHLKRHVDTDGRVYRTIKSAGKVYRYYDDEPTVPPDVWADLSHLQQKDPERVGYPTQKPAALLRRIVGATTRPGDLVADFFAGSGTTGAVARELDRRFLGCDVSPDAVYIASERLSASVRSERCGVLRIPAATLRRVGAFRAEVARWLGARAAPEGSREIHGLLDVGGEPLPLWIASPAARTPSGAGQLARFVRGVRRHTDADTALVVTWGDAPDTLPMSALEIERDTGVALQVMTLSPLEAKQPSDGRRLIRATPPPLLGVPEVERLGPLTYRFCVPGAESRSADGGLASIRWATRPIDDADPRPERSAIVPQPGPRFWEHAFDDLSPGRRVRVWCQASDAHGAARSSHVDLLLH